MSRTFNELPENFNCPLCGTNEKKKVCLVPIDGTLTGKYTCEAMPVHVDCLTSIDDFNYNREAKIFYKRSK